MAESLFGNRVETTALTDPQRQIRSATPMGGPCGITADQVVARPGSNYNGTRAGAWIRTYARHTMVTGYYPPNADTPDVSYHGDLVSGPRSAHTGGANVALCDGSVRMISDSIHLETLRNLFSRNDGNVLGEY